MFTALCLLAIMFAFTAGYCFRSEISPFWFIFWLILTLWLFAGLSMQYFSDIKPDHVKKVMAEKLYDSQKQYRDLSNQYSEFK